MIALLDNGQDLDECAAELGRDTGQLLTPLTRYRLRDPSRPFGIDNGRFSPGWNADGFLSLLDREKDNRENCKFVTVPDVVGSARRTLEVFDRWKNRLAGWPLALACQDGQEHLPIPWDEIAAVFIGGSTNWKCSDHAKHIVHAAQALGKWTHIGRINDPARWEHFEAMGADSRRRNRDCPLLAHAGRHRQQDRPEGAFRMTDYADLIALLERTRYLSDARVAASAVRALTEERDRLREALADAIRRPMGVIPASAEGLVTTADLDAAEARRVTTGATDD